MSRTWSEILVPVNGTLTINQSGGLYDGVFYAIKVDADSVFTHINNNLGIDVTIDYIMDPTATVKAGTLITPRNQSKPFGGIELTSGQVTLVL